MKSMKRWILGFAMTLTAAVALSGCGGAAHWGHVRHHPRPPCAPEAPEGDIR